MAEWGYDQSQPILVWDEGQVVIDGHTRLKAAQEAGIEDVPVHYKSFGTEDEALAYAIHLQRNRRNLTDAEIIRCIEALDMRKARGGDRKSEDFQKSKAPNGAIDKSAKETAKMIGVSPRKVERARTVLEHAEEPVKEAVKAGELSINRAYQETQDARRAQETGKVVFNRTNDNIEWASWTWNPVTGCKHGCPYCYARDIATRFYGKGGFEPKFHPERLSAPAKTRSPRPSDPIGERNVFVCSMADLFGEWVPQKWIDAVLEAVRMSPQWNFLFLTKNPVRLVGIDWPANAWVGATVDCQARVAAAERAFAQITASVKFLSCEPLLERITFRDLRVFDWLIIGPKRVGSGHEQPQWEWVENLLSQARAAALKVYFKPHLSVRPREYPKAREEEN
jgi:protein gp37